MTDWLVLLFDAPLMSFGGPAIDQHGVTRNAPGRAMLVGLLGNALGYDHRDATLLERLQTRLVHATLTLRAGERVVDFQTVDLGQPFLRAGWTTRGKPQARDGGPAASGTHIRLRHYLAEALRVVVATLEPGDEPPGLDALADALKHPARPLFLGRKACLPARPLLAGRLAADDAPTALRDARELVRKGCPDLAERIDDAEAVAEWDAPPGTLHPPRGGRFERLVDRRDWANQFHGGERVVLTGPLPPASDEDKA